MNQHIISRIAIYILASVMFYFGIRHLLYPDVLVVSVPDFLPGGKFWVYLTGVAFILAALSFFVNVWVRTAAYMLALLLFVIVLTIHLPNYLQTADKAYQQMALTNLLKDAALAAFALYIASNARHQRILEETEVEEEIKAIRIEPEPM
ncbi:DoxX family protein [Flavisolibacter nicotianae]|uniref:DoxX family protein n=1 Tax=Flavisolibacter nicotianae TaxID=2364882 RepID=UPI000EAFCD90|nr:DoxX family protein [Flavisolibacter nicotianae]